MNTKKLFGTDGIRGKVNSFPMTAEMAVRCGRAIALWADKGAIAISADTRKSSVMLQNAVSAGINSAGTKVFNAGVLPTPGLAFITRYYKACAGVVITASHNPYYYNGIKVFDKKGIKPSQPQEDNLEELIIDENLYLKCKDYEPEGAIYLKEAKDKYIDFLKKTVCGSQPFKGIKIVADCSNGATSYIAQTLFSSIGADIITIFCTPDGRNINEGCGSQNPEKLAAEVIKNRADIGLAFDGDGDRLIFVDEKGNILNGDYTLFILANFMKQKGTLKNNLVISTVMSNMGLSDALAKIGVKTEVSPVGDRFVMEMMRRKKAVIGGEDSGHTIMTDYHTTGDGLITALKLIETMTATSKTISEMAALMKLFPRIAENVKVAKRPRLDSIEQIVKSIKDAEKRLGKKGRVLVRYSGTEPVCRVMAEGEDIDLIRDCAKNIVNSVKSQLCN